MVNPPISPISLAQVEMPVVENVAVPQTGQVGGTSIFDQVLGRAVNALEGVSALEMNANKLIDDYVAGKAELSDVMIATSKMTLAVNLAVTTVTSAVASFKEITQMPI